MVDKFIIFPSGTPRSQRQPKRQNQRQLQQQEPQPWPIVYSNGPVPERSYWLPSTCLPPRHVYPTMAAGGNRPVLTMMVPTFLNLHGAHGEYMTCQPAAKTETDGIATSILNTAAANAPMTTAGCSVQIRSVWAHNLESEFILISKALVHHRFAAIDTEFPGVIRRSPKHPMAQTSEERYSLLKSNVDDLQLIQLGLTLSDEYGRLPNLANGATSYIWEFNFRGFDPSHDPHDPEALKMLKEQGIDFEANKNAGIDPQRFADLMMAYGLVLNNSTVTWIGFQNSYDLGFLIKTLMGASNTACLPSTLQAFHDQVRHLLGHNVFDVKYMMKFCKGLFGGLEKVAATLKVNRVVGKRHQAGSDSLLTLQVFRRMQEIYFAGNSGGCQHAGVLYGLDVM